MPRTRASALNSSVVGTAAPVQTALQHGEPQDTRRAQEAYCRQRAARAFRVLKRSVRRTFLGTRTNISTAPLHLDGEREEARCIPFFSLAAARAAHCGLGAIASRGGCSSRYGGVRDFLYPTQQNWAALYTVWWPGTEKAIFPHTGHPS